VIPHLLSAIVAACQLALAYFIMLALMTFNAGIFISVVIGQTLGYFVFRMPRVFVGDASVSSALTVPLFSVVSEKPLMDESTSQPWHSTA